MTRRSAPPTSRRSATLSISTPSARSTGPQRPLTTPLTDATGRPAVRFKRPRSCSGPPQDLSTSGTRTPTGPWGCGVRGPHRWQVSPSPAGTSFRSRIPRTPSPRFRRSSATEFIGRPPAERSHAHPPGPERGTGSNQGPLLEDLRPAAPISSESRPAFATPRYLKPLRVASVCCCKFAVA